MATTQYDYTEQDCIQTLRAAATHLGESPSKAQYEQLGWTPASATISRITGGWNAAKEKAGLETARSSSSRTQAPPDDIEVSSEAWHSMSVDQRWYYHNRDADNAYERHRRQRLRAWLYIHKESLGCTRCGTDDAACLDFHHVEDKHRALNELVTHGASAVTIYDELQRCEILCANCHRKEHLDSRDPRVSDRVYSDVQAGRLAPDDCPLSKERYLRIWTTLHKRDQGCQRCPAADPRCLQFHHPPDAEKVGGVGAMISDSRPVEVVKSEIGTCTVICANCHRQEHYSIPEPLPGQD